MSNTLEREQFLDESIKQLKTVNERLAKLNLLREQLVEDIIGALGHEHEGQKTYDYGVWRIEVKTPFIYSLNKKLYESSDFKIPAEFNPVKESFAYSVDKRLCDRFMTDAPKNIRDMLIELIEKKPGKANVVLKERV